MCNKYFMIEYRLKQMPQGLAEILEEAEMFVGEEVFKGETTYLIYSYDDISDILNELNIEYTSTHADETGWEDKWKEYIQEDWLTDDVFFIFEPKTFDDGRKTIYINPALAFGTGAHPTTKVAARLLQTVSEGNTVLDIGSGSGILAILASKSGATEVEAFDIDEQALPNCRENIENNGCTNIKAWAGELTDIADDKQYDVICANIISSVLLSLNDKVVKHTAKYIVYSGILISEYDEVVAKMLKEGYSVDEYLEIAEWCGVRFKKG